MRGNVKPESSLYTQRAQCKSNHAHIFLSGSVIAGRPREHEREFIALIRLSSRTSSFQLPSRTFWFDLGAAQCPFGALCHLDRRGPFPTCCLFVNSACTRVDELPLRRVPRCLLRAIATDFHGPCSQASPALPQTESKAPFFSFRPLKTLSWAR